MKSMMGISELVWRIIMWPHDWVQALTHLGMNLWDIAVFMLATAGAVLYAWLVVDEFIAGKGKLRVEVLYKNPAVKMLVAAMIMSILPFTSGYVRPVGFLALPAALVWTGIMILLHNLSVLLTGPYGEESPAAPRRGDAVWENIMAILVVAVILVAVAVHSVPAAMILAGLMLLGYPLLDNVKNVEAAGLAEKIKLENRIARLSRELESLDKEIEKTRTALEHQDLVRKARRAYW